MRLVLDADGLIKLHRAGVLTQVIQGFDCIVPRTVYDEVVTRGKARLHGDAVEIEVVVEGKVAIVQVSSSGPDSGLGAGEMGILALLAGEPGAIVVSDDRRFLGRLAMQDAPFLTPVDMLVLLTRRGVLTSAEAADALERLRPFIRLAAYWDARQDLASRGDEK